MALADRHVRERADLPGFYLQVIQPSMYEIGRLWEQAGHR